MVLVRFRTWWKRFMAENRDRWREALQKCALHEGDIGRGRLDPGRLAHLERENMKPVDTGVRAGAQKL